MSLAEYMLRTVGFNKTRKIGNFMMAWAWAESELGHEPTIEEYAAYWKVSAATAYREKALFREVFPDETSPSRIQRLAEQAMRQKLAETKERLNPSNYLAALRPADVGLSQI